MAGYNYIQMRRAIIECFLIEGKNEEQVLDSLDITRRTLVKHLRQLKDADDGNWNRIYKKIQKIRGIKVG